MKQEHVGSVTHPLAGLDQYTRATLNAISWNCESKWNCQMTLKIKVNDPYFQYQLRESQDAYLVQIWRLLLKHITTYSTEKSSFLEL